jgi:hypothetical protein
VGGKDIEPKPTVPVMCTGLRTAICPSKEEQQPPSTPITTTIPPDRLSIQNKGKYIPYIHLTGLDLLDRETPFQFNLDLLERFRKEPPEETQQAQSSPTS